MGGMSSVVNLSLAARLGLGGGPSPPRPTARAETSAPHEDYQETLGHREHQIFLSRLPAAAEGCLEAGRRSQCLLFEGCLEYGFQGDIHLGCPGTTTG